MRLFTGIDLPPAVVQTLEELLARLRPTARIKWSPPANLHITTRFIGEWPEERLAELRAALDGIRVPAPFPVSVRRLGFYPNPHAPRVFWAGVEDSSELTELAAETDRALENLGLRPEGRPYAPHLTLARIKGPGEIEGLREAIAGRPSLDFGTFVVDRFCLYRSRQEGGYSVYSKLGQFGLG